MYRFIVPRDPESGQPLEFLAGVPARHLTNQEWAELTNDQRTLARTRKLYAYAPNPKPAPAPAPVPAPAAPAVDAPEVSEVLEHEGAEPESDGV